MGGSSKTTQAQTSTYTPNSSAMSAYENLFPQAQQVASTSWNPATAMQVASLQPKQTQAFNQIGALQGAYQPYLDQATNYTQNAAAPISSSAIQGYMNPYQQDVVNATMAQLGQQQGQQTQQLNAGAIGQNALGGNRADIARGYLQGQQNLATGSTLAGLNQSNYQQALSAAQQDASRQMSAGQQMAGLGQLGQQLGLEGSQALYGAGNAQQAQEQNVLNASSSNAQSQTMWPYQNLQWLSSILSGVGPLMGGTTTSTGTTKQSETPGIGSMIGAGLSGLSLLSDERAKEGIEAVGKTFDGQNIYKYRYKGHPETHMGMLAQEVEGKHPEAVGNIGGLKTVNYDRATEDAAGRKGFADGGGAFADESYFPWATIKPAQSIVPQISASPRTSGEQATRNSADLSSLGQQARQGLGSLFRYLTGDGENSSGRQTQPSQGAGSSNIGSLFGFANGGSPRMAFAGGGDVDLASYNGDNASSPEDTGFLSRLLRGASDIGQLPIFNGWGSPSPSGAPEVPDSQKTALQVTPRSDRLTPDVLRMLPRAAPQNVNPQTSLLPDARSVSNVGEVGEMPKASPAAPVNDLSAIPTISSRLETGARDPLAGVASINKSDTGGSHSYGNFGINSGGSAQQFQRNYGAKLGLTGQPGTPEFDQQWTAAARRDPAALHAAEMDWHQANIASNVVGGLEKTGIPAQIASDPRVQAFFADRAVQYGPASTTNHADRIQFAYKTAGDDPARFLQAMATIDREGLGHDFKTYLSEHPNHIDGLRNRVDNRLQESLRLGGGQPQQGMTQQQGMPPQLLPSAPSAPPSFAPPTPPALPATRPSDLASNFAPQVAGTLTRSLPGAPGASPVMGQPPMPGIGMVAPANAAPAPQPSIGTPAVAQTPPTSTGAPASNGQSGHFGLLSGIGLDINPLNWTDEQRDKYLRLGMGMWGNNMHPGAGGLEGLKAGDTLAQQARQNALQTKQMEVLGTLRAAQLEAARARTLRAEQGTPEKRRFTTIGQDAFGQPLYGFVDPGTGEVSPYRAGGQQQATGEAAQPTANFADERSQKIFQASPTAQKLGAEQPTVFDRAVKVLAGEEPYPTATKGDRTAAAVQSAVRQIDNEYRDNIKRTTGDTNPPYSADRYDYRKKFDDPNKGVGISVKARETYLQHANDALPLIDQLPDTGLRAANAAANWWRGETSDPALTLWKRKVALLANEKQKAISGTAGAVFDRKEFMEQYNPNLGSVALHAAMAQDLRDIDGRLKPVVEDFKRKMGPLAQAPEYDSPETSAIMERIRSAAPSTAGVNPATRAGVSAAKSSMTTVSSPQHAQSLIKSGKLKSGDTFVDENGVTHRVK